MVVVVAVFFLVEAGLFGAGKMVYGQEALDSLFQNVVDKHKRKQKLTKPDLAPFRVFAHLVPDHHMHTINLINDELKALAGAEQVEKSRKRKAQESS